ncbi:MAG TPA: ROK family protein, partial [Candidatus Polarisedimenticolia bacterium]|nr:ROK family protein [Candidatus Polarisedimenticolia bacterium]
MDPILSIDIGGTKLAVSVVAPDGRTFSVRRTPSHAREGPEAMIARVIALARQAQQQCALTCATAGVSIGGPLDPVSGIILTPPNLPGWDRVPLRDMLAEPLGLAPSRVFLDNDANACALAEQRFGAARGRRHAIFLTMSTGLGGGLILDGKLYRGAGFNAGEAGHQVVLPDGPLCGCGGRGCLEAVASG